MEATEAHVQYHSILDRRCSVVDNQRTHLLLPSLHSERSESYRHGAPHALQGRQAWAGARPGVTFGEATAGGRLSANRKHVTI